MSSVLDYARRMSDREVRDDLDCMLAAAPEHEHEAIKAYRRARIGAREWAPMRPGANNHRHVRSDGSVTGRTCAVCGASLPANSRADRRFCGASCRMSRMRQADGPIAVTGGDKAAGQTGPNPARMSRVGNHPQSPNLLRLGHSRRSTPAPTARTTRAAWAAMSEPIWDRIVADLPVRDVQAVAEVRTAPEGFELFVHDQADVHLTERG